MPENCNGLALIDQNGEFSKLNCHWIYKKRGPVRVEKSEKKRRKKPIEKAIIICLPLNEDLYTFIQRQAFIKSSQTGIPHTSNDMIREALAISFPCPKQYDMFGSKNC